MSPIRVLGVNGSPRKYGWTYKLLRVALEAAANEGADVELINIYDYNLKWCIGCVSDGVEHCRYPCILEDDFRELAEEVLESDALIIATPIYWYAPSAALKNFIDRLTCFENMIFHEPGRSLLEGKVVGFIAVGNDTGAIMAIAWMMVTLNSMGACIPPWALAYYHQREGDPLDDPAVSLDAANVGKAVVVAARELKRVKKWYDVNLKTVVESVKEKIRSEASRNYELQWREREALFKKLAEKGYITPH